MSLNVNTTKEQADTTKEQADTKQEEMLVFERASVRKNVIEGVHLVGMRAKNRIRADKPPYTYKESALKQAVPLYENQDVYLSHGKANDERPIEAKIGYATNISFKEGVGVVGDLVLNEKHPFFGATIWWAQNKPDKLGMSHVATNLFDSKENAVVDIRKVHSIDIVSSPSTTDGLFKEGVIADKANERALENMLDASWQLIAEVQYPMQGNKLPMADRAVKIVPVIKDLAKELIKIAALKTTESEQQKESDMEYKDISIEELKKQRTDLVDAITKEAVVAHKAIEAKVQESVKDVPTQLKSDTLISLIREAVVANDSKKLTDLVNDRKSLVVTTSVESVSPMPPVVGEIAKSVVKMDSKAILAAAKKR